MADNQPKAATPLYVTWDIVPPPGTTFQATNGMHTTLRFVKGREVEVLNWLRNELERHALNTANEYSNRPHVVPTKLVRCDQLKSVDHGTGQRVVERCESMASYRYTWPGKAEQFICEGDVLALRTVATGLGLSLEIIPLEKEQIAPTVNGNQSATGYGFQVQDGDGEPVVVFVGASVNPKCVALVVDSSVARMSAQGARGVSSLLKKAAEALEANGGADPAIADACFAIENNGAQAKLIASETGITLQK